MERESDKLFEGMTYREAVEFQVEEWAKGNPLHNPVNPENGLYEGGECCPDFSCCNPDMLMPEESRQKFLEAHKAGDEKTKMQFLGMALSGLGAKMNQTVYVAGVDGEGNA